MISCLQYYNVLVLTLLTLINVQSKSKNEIRKFKNRLVEIKNIAITSMTCSYIKPEVCKSHALVRLKQELYESEREFCRSESLYHEFLQGRFLLQFLV